MPSFSIPDWTIVVEVVGVKVDLLQEFVERVGGVGVVVQQAAVQRHRGVLRVGFTAG